LQVSHRRRGGRLVVRRQQRSLTVEHGHFVRRHSGHCRRDEVANRTRRARVGGAVASNDNGRRRWQLLAPERSTRRHDDVNTGGLDAFDHLDGTSNFAFKRADPRDFLHE
jgi:hypothetical protein